MGKTSSKIYHDPEIGDVVFRKSVRSRSISIRVHPVKGVSVSIPYMVPFAAALAFFKLKRDWVVQTVSRQKKQFSLVKLNVFHLEFNVKFQKDMKFKYALDQEIQESELMWVGERLIQNI